MLLVMLIGSINYQLNLGYVLTFLLASCAGVSMHMTHATLKGLTLRLRSGCLPLVFQDCCAALPPLPTGRD